MSRYFPIEKYFMKKKFSIRLADAGDIPLIHSMADIAFRHTYANILSPEQTDYMMDMMYSESAIASEMKAGQVYHIGMADGEPAAYTEIEPQPGAKFHLQKIYVLPEYQGLGLGSFMFDEAVEYISKVCATPCVMELNVNRDNSKALRFYGHKGMKKVSQGDFDIGGGFFMNDFIMGLGINGGQL